MDVDSFDIRIFLRDKLQIEDHEALDQLSEAATFRSVPKGELLLETGDKPANVLVLWSGICRGFLVDENGEDTTDCFATERGCVLWGCGPLEEPSLISMETLTDCELYQISIERILKLMNNCDVLRAFHRYLANGLKLHWTMRVMLCQCTAMERYRWFLKHYPGLIDQVHKRYIASFLGMTPVTLSRLRKNLRESGCEE